MYKYYNPNPDGILVDDCIIRAICKITGKDWERVYTELFMKGLQFHDWPWRNHIWGDYLNDLGFKRFMVPDYCPLCMTVSEFSKTFDIGSYIVACDQHVLAVENGIYYDTVDSGDLVPIYYWTK